MRCTKGASLQDGLPIPVSLAHSGQILKLRYHSGRHDAGIAVYAVDTIRTRNPNDKLTQSCDLLYMIVVTIAILFEANNSAWTRKRKYFANKQTNAKRVHRTSYLDANKLTKSLQLEIDSVLGSFQSKLLNIN